MTLNKLREAWFDGFLEVGLEGFLGGSMNKYPTIPAIEVTIPHFNFLRETTRTVNHTGLYK